MGINSMKNIRLVLMIQIHQFVLVFFSCQSLYICIEIKFIIFFSIINFFFYKLRQIIFYLIFLQIISNKNSILIELIFEKIIPKLSLFKFSISKFSKILLFIKLFNFWEIIKKHFFFIFIKKDKFFSFFNFFFKCYKRQNLFLFKNIQRRIFNFSNQFFSWRKKIL